MRPAEYYCVASAKHPFFEQFDLLERGSSTFGEFREQDLLPENVKRMRVAIVQIDRMGVAVAAEIAILTRSHLAFVQLAMMRRIARLRAAS